MSWVDERVALADHSSSSSSSSSSSAVLASLASLSSIRERVIPSPFGREMTAFFEVPITKTFSSLVEKDLPLASTTCAME